MWPRLLSIFVAVALFMWGVTAAVQTGGFHQFWIGVAALSASWQIEVKRYGLAKVCALIAGTVFFAWVVTGADQRSPAGGWVLAAWPLWAALAFVLCSWCALRHLPSTAACLALCAMSHVALMFAPALGVHLLTEAWILGALLFVWIDPGGEHVARWFGKRYLGALGRERLTRIQTRMGAHSRQSA